MAHGAKDAPRCLIVDDHPVVRAGIRAVIEGAWKGAEVTDATTLEDAAIMLSDDDPDVVIIDPWRAGVDVGDIVSRLQKDVKAPIVIFTSDGGARLLSESLKAGVKGYVRKDSPSEDLVRAVEAARTGDFYVDPGLSSTIVLDEGDRTLSKLEASTRTQAVAIGIRHGLIE